MPCNLCHRSYLYTPCSGFRYHTIIPSRLEGKRNTDDKIIFDKLFKECPCKECLVKMMCEGKRWACEDYIRLIERVIDIDYSYAVTFM